jgi:hypothetical protein
MSAIAQLRTFSQPNSSLGHQRGGGYVLSGGCQCRGIRFEIADQPVNATICHCGDCRRQSGAPILAWAMVPSASLVIEGEPVTYASSESGRRSFCGTCGTGLFFVNGPLEQMGMAQVRIAALDEAEAVAPKMQVQIAERLDWMNTVDELPAFQRFPT